MIIIAPLHMHNKGLSNRFVMCACVSVAENLKNLVIIHAYSTLAYLILTMFLEAMFGSASKAIS